MHTRAYAPPLCHRRHLWCHMWTDLGRGGGYNDSNNRSVALEVLAILLRISRIKGQIKKQTHAHHTSMVLLLGSGFVK